MTAILALVRRDDFVADVDQLNLLDFSNGWALADDGWQQAIPGPADSTVIETLTLLVRGTSHDDLAANINLLDTKLEQVKFYADPEELYGVWLRVRMPNETGTRQALVKSASRSPAHLWAGEVRNPSGGYYYLEQYALALERMPLWEASVAPSTYVETPLSTVGGMLDYGAVAGVSPARLAQVKFDGLNAGGGPLSKFWIGFRTNRWGNRANFHPVWNLEKSYTFGADTTGAHANADATAADGWKVITTFATQTAMIRRATMQVSGAGANAADQRGTFLVLLRAKLSGAGAVNVRLASGLTSAPTFNARAPVAVSGTNWLFYEMGTVAIPALGRPNAAVDPLTYYALGVDAQQIGGTPSTPALHMDSLVLIPVGEGWMSADLNPGVSLGVIYAAPSMPLFIRQQPDGSKDAVWVDNFGAAQMNVVSRGAGGLPVGSGIIVVAAQRYNQSVLADTVSVSLSVYNRWPTLRGAA